MSPTIEFSADLCYTVQPGDWLWAIARRALSSSPRLCATDDPHVVARRVRALHRANRRVIGHNPNRLRPGMVLIVGHWTDAVQVPPPPCSDS
jgi:Tfp pilus assembly protein FimV